MLITIRQMQEDDTLRVSEIESNNFSQPWTQNAFNEAIRNENFLYLVALDDEKLVGYSGCIIGYDEADITNIAIDDEYRRMGIATELLKQLFILLSQKNITSVFLEVRQSNIVAQSLYNSIGFEPVGIRKMFYKKPEEDALLMKYELKNEDR